VEPESYLDMAVTKWLPRRWENGGYERALEALASRLEERHGDRWLHDVLTAKRSDRLAAGLAGLAEAASANLADESDRALAKSSEAADELQAAGNQAGALRARFEQTYALHRSLQSARHCLEVGAAVERQAEAMAYPWIRGQAILEQGNCGLNLGDSGEGQRDFTRALALVRSAGYSDLELRAEGLLAAVGTTGGNLLVAWSLGREGLAEYWSGAHSGLRAQQIYGNLSRAARSLDQRQAAYIFRRAEIEAIAETPRRRAEAATRAMAATLAVEAGWPDEARTQFDRAGALFDRLQQTSDRHYRALAELYRAEAELASGAPHAALQRLEANRAAAGRIDAAPDRIRFQEVLGSSLSLSGKPELAEAAYRQAIDLTEHTLSTLQGSRQRAELMLTAGEAYRGLIEVLLERGDSAGALRTWEWFRAGERPGPRDGPDLDKRRARLRGESFLAYVILPGGAVAAWLFDDRLIEGRRLSVKREELETVAYRFVRECADMASDPQVIQRDSRRLYDWLVAPLADRLDPARTLVIEPDGPVGAIPIPALMDGNSRYLGERFAIAIASGLTDYQYREAAGPITADLTALVVASPTLGEEAARAFPPLPGTMSEGLAVARRFPGSVLLTDDHATLAAVEQHRRDTGLFHFAGHGFSNAGNGGLLLSPDDRTSGGAGVLEGNRLANQDWSRCRLAVLSACSTGTGETKGPVNPESLVRGLLWAGVARVVASRWNMDSGTGVPFMDQFYTVLLSGNSVAAALQRAAQRVRENKETSHPYFWAGFQSFGTR
jgi:CHAT domain-containing protein